MIKTHTKLLLLSFIGLLFVSFSVNSESLELDTITYESPRHSDVEVLSFYGSNLVFGDSSNNAFLPTMSSYCNSRYEGSTYLSHSESSTESPIWFFASGSWRYSSSYWKSADSITCSLPLVIPDPALIGQLQENNETMVYLLEYSLKIILSYLLFFNILLPCLFQIWKWAARAVYS